MEINLRVRGQDDASLKSESVPPPVWMWASVMSESILHYVWMWASVMSDCVPHPVWMWASVTDEPHSLLFISRALNTNPL